MTTVVVAASRIKQAGEAYNALTSQVQQQNSQQMFNRTLGAAGGAGLLGLGAGISIPAMSYLLSRIRQATRKAPPRDTSTDPIQVPVKMANMLSDAANSVTNWGKGVMTGGTARHPISHPAFLPLVGGLAVGGTGIGLAVSDKIRKALRKSMIDSEIEQAKQDYEDALAGQTKQAQQLHQDLDAIYDSLQEKKASLEDIAGTTLGAAGLYALLAGTGGFMLGKSYGDKTQNRRLIEQAQRLRRRHQYLKQPMPLSATTRPRAEEASETAVSGRVAPSLF